MAIAGHYDINDLPYKKSPPSRAAVARATDRDGYGGRIPTSWMVQLPGSPRWRRVYAAFYSNMPTTYVEVKGRGKMPDWITISGSPR